MEKFIERLFDALPKPVVIAIVSLIIVTWLIQSLTNKRRWTTAVRTKWFSLAATTIVLATGIYYVPIVMNKYFPSKQFAMTGRGIAVFTLLFDEKHIVQTHLVDFSNIQIQKLTGYTDVDVRAVDIPNPGNKDDASDLCRAINAKFCVYGSYIPPDAVNLFIVSPLSPRDEASTPLTNYLDAQKFVDGLVGVIDTVRPLADDPAVKIRNLESQLSALQSRYNNLNDLLSARNAISPIVSYYKPEFLDKLKERKRRILTIGIDQYEDRSYPPLRGSADDAMMVAEAFRNALPNAEVGALLHDGATKASILGELDKIASEIQKADEQVIVYLTGHAVLVKGEAYFVPYDGKPVASVKSADSWIALKEVYAKVSALPSDQAVLVLDTCYSGTAFGATLGVAPLSDFREGKGRLVLAATTGDGLAYVNKGHSVLATAIVNGLRGEADINRDGIVSGMEIVTYSAGTVPVLSPLGLPQKPSYFSSISQGDIPLTLVSDPSSLSKLR